MQMPSLSSPWSPVEVRQKVAAPRDDVFNALSEKFRQPPSDESDDVAELPLAADAEAVEVHGHRKVVVQEHVGPVRTEVEFSLVKRGTDETEIVMRERPLGPTGLVTPVLRPLLAVRNQRAMHQFARYVENEQRAAS
jgi:hypothetical protein